MAPTREAQYVMGEKVLCFHGEFLYESKIIGVKPVDEKDKKSAMQYNVHYKGWKNTWDDWVQTDRLKKHTEENVETARMLKAQADAKLKASDPKNLIKKKAKADSEFSSNRGSEDRQVGGNATGRGQKRGRPDNEIEKESDFYRKPSIKLNLPDHLKSILVDDWEYVTKNTSTVQLPSDNPVNKILDTYYNEELEKRRPGSADAEILEEVMQGLKEYFDKCLGTILLYRFERQQYYDVKRALNGELKEPIPDEWRAVKGKGVADVYGAEHLARLFASLPELIAQTNMDAQSVKRLRDEIQLLAAWLSKHSNRYFTHAYETASLEYQELVKGLNDEGLLVDAKGEGKRNYALR